MAKFKICERCGSVGYGRVCRSCDGQDLIPIDDPRATTLLEAHGGVTDGRKSVPPPVGTVGWFGDGLRDHLVVFRNHPTVRCRRCLAIPGLDGVGVG
jgi:hypothetical protein